MSTSKKEEKEKKNRQKKLRKGLLAFLKRLRKACESYESLADWNDLIQPLESMVNEYAQDMPQDSAQRLKEAMHLKEATAKGIQEGCKILKGEIDKVIDLLPVSSILVPALVGAFIVVAVGVAAVVVLLNATAHEVLISNQGCGDVPIPSLVQNIPGVNMPAVIQNDQTTSATISSVWKVEVEVGGQVRTMTVWISSIPLHFNFENQIEKLTFDNADLMNQRTTLDFGNNSSHKLIFTCQ